MQVFGLTITRTKTDLQTKRYAAVDQAPRAWWPLVREATAGAWQRNEEITLDTVTTHVTVLACLNLIAQSLGKMPLRLVEQVDPKGDIWQPIENSAFSPVLRKPNHYQTQKQFLEWWITSKLLYGNTYVLKQRDARGVVTSLYVLNSLCVTPLVAPDGSVFYQLKSDTLNTLGDEVVVPAREIIHDRMPALFHPLIGVSPITAAGLAALQGLKIQNNSEQFFANGSNPGGVLSAPGQIAQETADRIKAYWDTAFTGPNSGKVAVLGDGLKYEPMMMSATDSQLIEQLDWTTKSIATAFGLPPSMVGGEEPSYANAEIFWQQLLSRTLQTHAKDIEDCLDFGLGLLPNRINGVQYGTEFDVDYLLLLDTASRTKAAADAINGGMSPNEARQKFHGLGPVAGGDSPMVQQQYYSLEALARRDAEEPAPPTPEPPGAPSATPEEADDMASQWTKGWSDARLTFSETLRERPA